jgi:phospholipid/cholesterol/gamma-HCH transport system ATP-binding protein
VPDNIGMLFRGNLVMFGPREVLLTSDNPVITQFVNGRRIGPIGMSEEKDEATLAAEKASYGAGAVAGALALMPQLVPSPGMPERQAVQRRTDRVMALLPSLPTAAQQAILDGFSAGGQDGAQAPAPPPATAPLGPAAQEREQAQTQARAEAWKLAREREAAARREAAAGTGAEGEQPAGGPGSWPPDWPGGGG